MLVTVDTARHRIVVRSDGFVDRETMARAVPAISSAVREAKGGGASFDCLIITRSEWPTAKDASADHMALLDLLRGNGLRRSAQVGFAALARLQLLRLTQRDPAYAFFATEAEADAWLSD